MNMPAHDTEFHREVQFTDAWKRAIKLSGVPKLFYGDPDKNMGKDSLAPKVMEIIRALPRYPKSRVAWLLFLLQLYNPREGARLADKSGLYGIGDLVQLMSAEQRSVMTDLLYFYRGW